MSPLTIKEKQAIKEKQVIKSLVGFKFPTTLVSDLSPSYNNGGYACNKKDNYRKRKVEEEAGQQHKKIKNYSINDRTPRKEIWKDNLQKVKTYINTNKTLPKKILLGFWLSHQKENYKEKKNIMKIDEIRKEWEFFIEEYEEYFKSNEEIWKENLEKVKTYINKNKKIPKISQSSKNEEIKSLGFWLKNQKQFYKNKERIMKIDKIRKEWEIFIEEYEEYFKSNEEIWKENLEKVKTYINENKKLPSTVSKNEEIKSLGIWLHNKKQFKKIDKIKEEWEIFIKEYEEYFKSNEEIWKENLEKVKTYINENKKLPSVVSKNEEIKSLGLWLKYQKHIYKNKERIMKIDEIRKEWEIFIKEYKEYFKSYFKSYLQLWI